MKRCVIALLVCLFAASLQLSNAYAQSSWRSFFQFSDRAPSPTFLYHTKPWTSTEKAIVMKQLALIQAYAPGLMARAIVYGPIKIYRVPDKAVRTAKIKVIALASPRKRYIIFSNKYFKYYYNKHLRWAAFWATVHELTHLVDAGDKLSLSRRWNTLAGWRIKAYHDAVKGRQLGLKERGKLAKQYALVSSYSAKDLNEALAEYTAAILTARVPGLEKQLRGMPTLWSRIVSIPDPIKLFVEERLFSKDVSIDLSNKVFFKGYHYFSDHDYKVAIKEFSRAIKLDPHFIIAYYYRGKSWSLLKNYQKAIQNYKKALQLNTGVNFLTVRLYHEMALDNLYQKKYREALSYLKQSIKINPRDGYSYYYMGRVYQGIGDTGLAIQSYKRAIVTLPKYSSVRKFSFYYMGAIMMKEKRYKDAVDLLSTGIQEYPNYGRAYYLSGLAWYYQKSDQAALNNFSKAIQLIANNDELKPYIYYYMGRIYQFNKNYSEAIEKYKGALRLNPRIGIAFYELGNIYYYYLKKSKQSLVYLKQSIRYLPKPSVHRKLAFVKVGFINLKLKDNNAAVKTLSQAIKEYPDLAKAYLLRGIAYYYKREYRKAEKDLERAFKLDPRLKNKHQRYLDKARIGKQGLWSESLLTQYALPPHAT